MRQIRCCFFRNINSIRVAVQSLTFEMNPFQIVKWTLQTKLSKTRQKPHQAHR